MNNLTAIVISFLRPRYTADCIRSLRETYPDINILVGENGHYNKELEEICQEVDAEYIDLEFDSGVPAGRNELIKRVETDYVLVGDDDFLYDEEAKVDQMVDFLESKKEFDLVGGRVFENGQVKNYQGYIEIYDDHLNYVAVHENEVDKKDNFSGLSYKEVDLTFNYFVARTDEIKDVLWDENIKVAFEHSHFFIHLKKAGKKVAFSPEPIVKHKHQDYGISDEYKKFRTRRSDKHYFFKSLGIEYSNDMNGSTTRIDKKGDKKYYAKENIKIKGRNYGKGDIVILEDKQPKGVMDKLEKA